MVQRVELGDKVDQWCELGIQQHSDHQLEALEERVCSYDDTHDVPKHSIILKTEHDCYECSVQCFYWLNVSLSLLAVMHKIRTDFVREV